MKFKDGDKARIRKDLDTSMSRDNVTVNDDMLQYSGDIVTITRAYTVGESPFTPGQSRYEIKENEYLWDDELLEEIAPKIKLTKVKRNKLIKKIVREINSNKEFKKSFKNVNKEVNEWSDEQIINWDK